MNSSIPPIIFVRHGETDWNAEGRIQGSIDTDLNTTGREQAQSVALALLSQREELEAYDFIVSPLRRAQETMAAINSFQERPQALIQTEALVREINFGIWEGKSWAELRASGFYPVGAEERFFWRPEGGESYADGTSRIEGLLARLVRPTLIVAHGGIGRCMIGSVSGMLPDNIVDLQIPQGCYCRLEGGKALWFDANKVSA